MRLKLQQPPNRKLKRDRLAMKSPTTPSNLARKPLGGTASVDADGAAGAGVDEAEPAASRLWLRPSVQLPRKA
jgi:hypothetical protein